jgi:mRNA interferase HigB
MRIVAVKNLAQYWRKHPETKTSLEHWVAITEAAHWKTTSEVKASFANAVVLNSERVRFEIHGGDYRLIVAFKFKPQIAYICFLGAHKEYDRIDALTIWRF